MKLPNGYGTIYKETGNRRKPYRVRITLKQDDKRVRKTLGYYETREEALKALAEYNSDPYDFTKHAPTFSDIYKIWVEESQFSQNTLRAYQEKYRNACKSLHEMPYKDITLAHLQQAVNSTESISSKNKIIKFLRSIGRCAYKHDAIEKDYAQFLRTYSIQSKRKKPFSEEEIERLWNNLDKKNVDYILINIYTGFRPEEFTLLKTENIDLDNDIIIGGGKTKAGTNRRVPIHPRIKPLIQKRLKDGRRELFRLTDKTYRTRFKQVMESLNMEHTPHDCRHTLRTRLDNLDINPVTIDRIMGHASGRVGEDVYTHKTIEQLKEAINKLK